MSQCECCKRVKKWVSRTIDERVNMWEWMSNDGSSTCFQITTKTMSEMMTMTSSTSTAAATVSSGWGPVQEESQWTDILDGEHINHMDAICVCCNGECEMLVTCASNNKVNSVTCCIKNVLCQASETVKSIGCPDYSDQKVCWEDNADMGGGRSTGLRGVGEGLRMGGCKAHLEGPNGQTISGFHALAVRMQGLFLVFKAQPLTQLSRHYVTAAQTL